ncbi:MAG: hypothetical protein JRI23_09050 [Deltaproteobacteria bacterium]|jgi:hypothetical protein|nr:hypothetical protein [Deltaproteobacteria bacterium]MBW2531785.1 hypothetical protein [Deltaproteobacteria bacterium]
MDLKSYRIALGLVASALVAGACTTTVESAGPEDDEETVVSTTRTGTGTGAGTSTDTGTGTGCGAGPDESYVPASDFVSDCGGFAQPNGAGDPPAYCDAEVLHWTYDATTQTLELIDTRVELNCCGDHSMSIVKLGDAYVVTELDAPEGGGARCNCSCVFDFGISAEGIAEETISLELRRHVTDQGDSTVVFEGTLDLTAGAGWELLDDMPAMFCGEPQAS